MKRRRKLAGVLGVMVCMVSLLLGGQSVGMAATLQIDANGILMGATGVDINGTLYNVEFLDGSCQTLFSGCDEPADFAFTAASSSYNASEALLTQVFVDGPQGLFDSNPSLTAGCTNSDLCIILTPGESLFPVEALVYVRKTYNYSAIAGSDLTQAIPEKFQMGFNTGDPGFGGESLTWARWTISSQPVPEPSSVLLLASGLLGLAGYHWRQRRQAGLQVG